MPEEILQPLIDGAAQGDQAALVDQQIDVLQKITDYDIKEWPIEVLVEKFTNGKETDESEIFIPDYQRDMVWSARQQSRFIESILIKLPVPFIFHQRVKTTGFQPVSFSCENEEAGGVRWTTDTAVTRYFRSSITLCG